MSVEQAIHEQWSTYCPLTNLVPIERVFTGDAVFNEGEEVYPYVTLELAGQPKQVRTSSAMIVTDLFRFNIWAGDESGLDQAKAVRNEIIDRFKREHSRFDWSRGTVLDMKRTNELQIQDPAGGWHLMIDMQALVEERE